MVRNLMMIFGLTLAVAAFGCDSDSGNPAGSGGSGGGEGGAGGAGEGGAGGVGGAPAATDYCDNMDDLMKLEGDEPPDATSTACGTAAAITNPELCTPTSDGYATCLATGNDGATTGSELSADCLSCWADLTCCTLAKCSVLVGGPCAGTPMPGDECEMCTDLECGDAFEACSGLAYP
jgi:hypothetical protein